MSLSPSLKIQPMADDKRRAIQRNLEAAEKLLTRSLAARDEHGAAEATQIIEWATAKLRDAT